MALALPNSGLVGSRPASTLLQRSHGSSSASELAPHGCDLIGSPAHALDEETIQDLRPDPAPRMTPPRRHGALHTTRTARNDKPEVAIAHVEPSNCHAGTFDVTFPERATDGAHRTTNSEQLTAAAHPSCYPALLSALIAEAGDSPPPGQVPAGASHVRNPGPGSQPRGTSLDVSLGG